jgi:hypothetical protein
LLNKNVNIHCKDKLGRTPKDFAIAANN